MELIVLLVLLLIIMVVVVIIWLFIAMDSWLNRGIKENNVLLLQEIVV